MEKEIEDKLCDCMTEANDRFMEVIALLEVMGRTKEDDSVGCSLIYLTQDLVKKVFNRICYCKKILDFI